MYLMARLKIPFQRIILHLCIVRLNQQFKRITEVQRVAQHTKIYTSLTSFLERMSGSNQVIVGLILGAMMAIDMGGPINKAAYTFGIAMLDAGNFSFMAAVMAAGMVPPLGIALATTLFKNKFTPQERE